MYIKDMREGKLCSETLSSWPEYIMLQSLLLLFIHDCSFDIAFYCFKDLSNHSPKVGDNNI